MSQLDAVAEGNEVVDLSLLHVLLRLDFIGEVAFGTDLNTLPQGPGCRIMKNFDTVLPELMKCGLFPLRAKIPVLKSVREMQKAIAELKSIQKAVQNARGNSAKEKDGKDNPGKRIYEILAQYDPSLPFSI